MIYYFSGWIILLLILCSRYRFAWSKFQSYSIKQHPEIRYYLWNLFSKKLKCIKDTEFHRLKDNARKAFFTMLFFTLLFFIIQIALCWLLPLLSR